MLQIQKAKRRQRWKRYQTLRAKNGFTPPRDYRFLKRYFNQKGQKAKFIQPAILEFFANMDFVDHIDTMVEFTNQVKNIKKLQTKKLQINHKKARSISVAALLYIVAQIDYLIDLKYGTKEKRLKYSKKLGLDPHNDKLKYLFHKIGYWRYFGIKKPYKIPRAIEDVLFLRIHTNTSDKFEYLNEIKKFIQKQVKLFDDYEKEYKFDDAVKEALGNALEHAYPSDFDEPGKKKGKWWICGFYDKTDKYLEIIFYDYGVGIRESIRRNLDQEADRSLWDKIQDGLVHDGKLIEIALTAELSKYKRYKERDRGKGFKRFRDFAKALGYNCTLVVVSGNGVVHINIDENQEHINSHKIQGRLDGMLIKWQIRIGEKDGNDTI